MILIEKVDEMNYYLEKEEGDMAWLGNPCTHTHLTGTTEEAERSQAGQPLITFHEMFFTYFANFI